MSTISEKKEKLEFGAETGKILHLMIHSLYTNKDIFLRELISNASDASDKLRYLSVTSPELSKIASDFKIVISANEKDRTITIQDNGIGMNKEDLINNLGTIASSGTQKFANQLTGDKNKDLQLIGQFGVGFYSSFMIADKVEVITQKAGEDKIWKWSSDGEGSYEIEELDSIANNPYRTTITLHLRKDMDEYLDKFRIKHIVKTYSDHISIPIEFIDENNQVEVVNNGSAIWTRSKSSITEEQYKDFYKTVSHMPDSPWMILHNKNEGALEYTNLLYIPSNKTYDLFHPDRKSRVKLYVKKVFITDEGVDLIPANLRFIRGIIDSEDLPLNISRETLQYNNVIAKIKKSVSHKIYSELKKRLDSERDSYEGFWNNFGACIKEGLCESLDDKSNILDICLFRSVKQNKFITLDEYINSMHSDQKEIYYLSGDDHEKLKNSPQIEGFIKRDIDVLLFTDTVDDFWVNVCHQYKEKEIKSVTRADIELGNIDDLEKESPEDQNSINETDRTAVIEFFKNTLNSMVSDAKISGKLTNSPVCLSVAEGGMDMRMERYLKEQKQLAYSSNKIIEINPKHPIIIKIAEMVKNNLQQEASSLVKLLFDQACIIEGEQIQDPIDFANRLDSLISRSLNI